MKLCPYRPLSNEILHDLVGELFDLPGLIKEISAIRDMRTIFFLNSETNSVFRTVPSRSQGGFRVSSEVTSYKKYVRSGASGSFGQRVSTHATTRITGNGPA